MQTYPLTRTVVIQGSTVAAGTVVKASFNDKTGRTTVVAPGVGRRSFQVAPVRF